jgi:hypothetical protein
VIELVHNKRQIHSLHAGVIPQDFPQAMSAEVAGQSNITADINDELPSLPSIDGSRLAIHFGVKEHKVLRVLSNTRICLQIFFENFLGALIDHHFVTFVPFLFVNPEATFVTSPII